MKYQFAISLFLATFIGVSAQVKTPIPPPVKVPFAESLQAVVITTSNWESTVGTARLYGRNTATSEWLRVGDSFSVVVGRNGLAWSRDSAPEDFANDAPTLTPIFRSFCSAMFRKDEKALRNIYSTETLKEFRRGMKDEGVSSVAEYLSTDNVSPDFCEIRNEHLAGSIGSAEVRTSAIPNGFLILFTKEKGRWKLTNKSPELKAVRRTNGDSKTFGYDRPKFIPLKLEGDGKGPAGKFPLTFAFGSGVKAETVTLPYKKLDETTNCVDDVNSFHYNKVVGSLQVGIFDWKSSEKMLAVGAEYELGIFVAHNTYPVRKGDGSCIFLHIWKDATSPTSGCTAMERANLERILSWANPKSNPYLVQLPVDEYTKMTKAWNLPKL